VIWCPQSLDGLVSPGRGVLLMRVPVYFPSSMGRTDTDVVARFIEECCETGLFANRGTLYLFLPLCESADVLSNYRALPRGHAFTLLA